MPAAPADEKWLMVEACYRCGWRYLNCVDKGEVMSYRFRDRRRRVKVVDIAAAGAVDRVLEMREARAKADAADAADAAAAGVNRGVG